MRSNEKARKEQMKEFSIEMVESKRQKREFLNLANRIYKDNPYWVHPLDGDIEGRFDPERNELMGDGEVVRWLVRDRRGDVVGRLAAFYNREMANRNEQPTGGCGFFESIDNQQVANMMFDSARDWLAERGMEAMDGPINFGDRNQWWGLLVEGYEKQPLYCANYNPPHYKELFENYGFQNYFNQHTYLRDFTVGDLSQSVYERAKRLAETPGYRFEHIKKNNLDNVVDDFMEVYNKAWASFEGVPPMDREHTQELLKSIKPIMDEKLIHFAYYEDKPIGFFVMVPDLNRLLGSLKGKMNLINGLRLLLKLKFSKKNDRAMAIIFGVVPEFQGKGVESGMMSGFEQVMTERLRYKTAELMWIGDFNPLMMRVAESYVCASRHKMHTTYRYLFDRTKEFRRAPRQNMKSK